MEGDDAEPRSWSVSKTKSNTPGQRPVQVEDDRQRPRGRIGLTPIKASMSFCGKLSSYIMPRRGLNPKDQLPVGFTADSVY